MAVIAFACITMAIACDDRAVVAATLKNREVQWERELGSLRRSRGELQAVFERVRSSIDERDAATIR